MRRANGVGLTLLQTETIIRAFSDASRVGVSFCMRDAGRIRFQHAEYSQSIFDSCVLDRIERGDLPYLSESFTE